MSDSFVNCLIHVIFGTKERRPYLTAEVRKELYPMMAEIAKDSGFMALKIGGTEDHVHLLLSLPSSITLADAVAKVKAISSGWLHRGLAPGFSWQRGYGAFSVSLSNKQKVIDYISSQEEHHKKMDFRAEFIAYLKQHNIPYDPHFI